MKTFEEALLLCSKPIDDAKEAEEIAAMKDVHERYRELAHQARTSSHLRQTMEDWLDILGDKPKNCIFTAFMSGLITGIEMEKQELT